MKRIISLVLTGAVFFACNRQADHDSRKQITVSILPQKYFVERIAGDRFSVHVMVSPGSNPENYEFSPVDLKNAANSELYFKAGYIDFERVLADKLSSINPRTRVIDLSEGNHLIRCSEKDEHHQHAGGIDPHTWLSPLEVKIQAKNILNALVGIDPPDSVFFKSNYYLFLKDLDSLDKVISSGLSNLKTRKFIIYHPALTYYARDYQLEQFSIEIDGKSPSPRDIKNIIDMAKKEKISVVFVQKQFDTHTAQLISDEIGGTILPFDPLNLNWKENMLEITSGLSKALRK